MANGIVKDGKIQHEMPYSITLLAVNCKSAEMMLWNSSPGYVK